MAEKSEQILSGLEEICGYYGRGRGVVRRLIEEENFPARKICGNWESSKSLIDAWHLRKVSSDDNMGGI